MRAIGRFTIRRPSPHPFPEGEGVPLGGAGGLSRGCREQISHALGRAAVGADQPLEGRPASGGERCAGVSSFTIRWSASETASSNVRTCSVPPIDSKKSKWRTWLKFTVTIGRSSIIASRTVDEDDEMKMSAMAMMSVISARGITRTGSSGRRRKRNRRATRADGFLR